MTLYPTAPRSDHTDVLHGITVPDPFRTLEDESDPATVAWSAAQAELFAEHQATWDARPALQARLTELLGAGNIGTPAWRGGRAYFARRTAEQEHAVLLTIDPDGTERTLVDPMAIDASGTTTLDGWKPSKSGDLLAYQLSAGGTEESVLSVLDVATGEDVDGPIDRARYSPVAWLPDGKAFYYVRRLAPEAVPTGEEQYHRRVYLHRLGTEPDSDVEIFGAGLDKTNYYGVSVSRDGRWLIVTAAQGTSPRNDLWLADIDASDPATPELVAVQVGVDARAYPHVGRDGRLYIWTDEDAPRGRLAVADPTEPGQWRDLLPQDPQAVLEDYAILDDLERPVLVASWTSHAISEITVHDLATGERTGALDLPALGTVGGLSERPEGGYEAWFAYTDHATPTRILRYDARSGEVTTWAESPGAVEVPSVRSRQITYRSKGGTEVRMVIVSPTGEPDQPRPAVLYGYGGFSVALTPAYSAGILAWVEAGGVWAVANLRGGSEEGEAWHRAGMRENKQNVFDDFFAAAEYLIGNGWTTRDQLGISGGSNGGLLVGAALTQRPELFRAVVCSAPLLDMVRYEKFGLGATWNDEYGTADDPEELSWLLSYSPYHRVRDGVAYPAVLFTVFEGDTRVDTMHARKMCAALQAATTGGIVLLRAEREVGHGARAVSRTVDLAADQLAFLRRELTS
ncbi:MAG TPA: prolyl oligopeptidase family serine peptidase [Jiangellaceae bacterium]